MAIAQRLHEAQRNAAMFHFEIVQTIARMSVEPEPRTEIRIEFYVLPYGRAHFERGFLGVIEIARNGKTLLVRKNLMPTCIPAASAVFFKQFVCTVQNAASAAGYCQRRALGFQIKTIASVLVRGPQQYRLLHVICRSNYRKLHVGHSGNASLKFFCGIFDGFS